MGVAILKCNDFSPFTTTPCASNSAIAPSLSPRQVEVVLKHHLERTPSKEKSNTSASQMEKMTVSSGSASTGSRASSAPESDMATSDWEKVARPGDKTAPAAVEKVPPRDFRPKKYHVFISYRVATDANLAEKLCDKLQLKHIDMEPGLRIRCFLDKERLTLGKDWSEDFLDGLKSSCLFLPLISEAAILPWTTGHYTGTWVDNVLLEYETALARQKAGEMDILPLLIGTVSKESGYKRFSGFKLPFSDLPSLSDPSSSPKDTLARLFQIQGAFLNPEELPEKIGTIVAHLSQRSWPRFRNIWENQDELAPEKVLKCVQCQRTYLESQNADGACGFHVGQKLTSHYSCCGATILDTPPQGSSATLTLSPNRGIVPLSPGRKYKSTATFTADGCQRSRHRSKHHSDYKYLAKYEYVSNILNYEDHSTTWGKVTCESYGEGEDNRASIGIVLVVPDTGKLYISVESYGDFFELYSTEDLAEVESDLLDGVIPPLIRKVLTGDGSGWSSAAWLLESGRIVGVELQAQSAEATRPSIARQTFSWSRGGKIEPIKFEVLQKGGLQERKATRPYTVKTEVYYKGVVLREACPASAPFKTDLRSTGTAAFRIKQSSAITANDRMLWGPPYFDRFLYKVAVINLTDLPLTLLEASSQWAILGSPLQPTKCTKCSVSESDDGSAGLPLTIAARGVAHLDVVVEAEDPTKKDADSQWLYRAWVARNGPVAIALSIEEVSGEKAVLVSGYMNNHPTLKAAPEDKDDVWMFVDDPKGFARKSLTISRDRRSGAIAIRTPPGTFVFSYDTRGLRTLVYKALRDDLDVVPLDIKCGMATCQVQGEAWVDRDLLRVYAFRIHLRCLSSGAEAIGVYAVPQYGGSDELNEGPPSERMLFTAPKGFSPLSSVLLPASTTTPDFSMYLPSIPVGSQAMASGGAAASTTGGGGGEWQNKVLEKLAGIESKLGDMDKRLANVTEAVARLGEIVGERRS